METVKLTSTQCSYESPLSGVLTANGKIPFGIKVLLNWQFTHSDCKAELADMLQNMFLKKQI